MLVINYAIGSSKKTGYCAALGITFSAFILIVLSQLGTLSFMINSPIIFSFAKYSCSTYLAYISIKTLVSTFRVNSSSNEKDIDITSNISPIKAFIDGTISTLLNPKAILYFLLVFSQVTVSEQNPLYVFLYGFEIIGITLLWFITIAKCLSVKTIRVFYFRYLNVIQRIFAIILLSMAIFMLKQ